MVIFVGGTKKLAAIFLALAAALLLSGCTFVGDMDGGPMADSDKLGFETASFPAYNNAEDMICKELEGPHPCYAMFCENSTYWALELLGMSSWFDTTLVDGECTFEETNLTEYNEKLKDAGDNYTARAFMVGFGPSFTSTDNVNRYCNYSLQLATKWMKGAEGSPPAVPNTDRAECWLERNTLPVYIYYTDGKEINNVRTSEIAAAFNNGGVGNSGEVGPALITTELNLDSSDPDFQQKAASVKDQIIALDNCDKCLTVLAVKSGDTEALKEIFGDPLCYIGGTCTELYNKTDIIGFGFLANEYPSCNLNDIIGENFRFSRTILQNYSKPSIWLYAGASIGNNSYNNCSWDAGKVHDFYKNIFAITPSFPSAGVMGVSFYEATDGTGPFNCTDGAACDYGLFYTNGSQKHPEMNSWATFCQDFATQDARPKLLFSKNGRGAVCDTLQPDQLATTLEIAINTDLALNYDELVPADKVPDMGCGEICPSDSEMPNPDIYDNAVTSTGGSYTFTYEHCTDYPVIDEMADSADISAIYMRAIFEEESAFDPFAVSCSPSACNTYDLNASEICLAAGYGADCAHANGDPGLHDCPAGQHECAFGIGQCITLPGQYYADNGITIPSNIQNCGGADYDPFDPTDGACCGINVFSTNLQDARAFFTDNWAQLAAQDDGGVCEGGITAEERPWAEYYLASVYYAVGYGNVNPTYGIQAFRDQRDYVSDGSGGMILDACSNEQHYIKYLQAKDNDFKYSKVPMSEYLSAVSVCGSDCPGAE